MCSETIDDDEILIRFVYEDFQFEKGKLRPYRVFRPDGDKGASVFRKRYTNFNDCKKFAKKGENNKKKFIGYVLIKAKTITELGLKIINDPLPKVDGKCEIKGHANIRYNFELEHKKELTPEQREVVKSLYDNRLEFVKDPKPNSIDWD